MMIIGSQHIPVISTQVITEIQKVMKDKFQEKERDVEAFIEDYWQMLGWCVIIRSKSISKMS